MHAFLALPAVALAALQYQPPANPPDPAAHLQEMLALYDSVCLRAFPDDEAVAREMRQRGAEPLPESEIRRYLHDDPGTGWRLNGRTARFDITLEAPPFHACGVRTVTAGGFPDLGPYRELTQRFEADRGFEAIPRVEGVVGNVRTSGGGEQRMGADGGGEALLIFLATPVEGHRDNGQTGVEVRFVHQLADPPRRGSSKNMKSRMRSAAP